MDQELLNQIDRMTRIRHGWAQIPHTWETRKRADDVLAENQQLQRQLLDWEIALLDWRARDTDNKEAGDA
jgi:hypothetical protein